MKVEQVLSFLQSLQGDYKFEVRNHPDGGLTLHPHRNDVMGRRAGWGETDLYNLAKAAGFEVEQNRSAKDPDWYGPLYVHGEVPESTDLRRLAVEAGIRLRFEFSSSRMADLFAGVNLADSDLLRARIVGLGGQHSLVADFRGARPLEAFRVSSDSWDPGVTISALDLARCAFDAEQMEAIVRLIEAAPGSSESGLAVVRNAACTAEQVDRVVAAMPEGTCGITRHLLCAPGLPEARLRELAEAASEEEFDILLSDDGLQPIAREILVSRRMARAPEPWRSLPPASIEVRLVEPGAIEKIEGDLLAEFALGEEFPRDAFRRVGEWWSEYAAGHSLQIYIREDGELNGILVAESSDEGHDYSRTVAVVTDPATVFADYLPELTAQRLARQDAAIATLRTEYRRKLAEARAVRARLARLAGQTN